MSTIPLRPLGFGEIVDGAVQLYRRDFGLYYLIVLIAALPGYVFRLLFEPNLSDFSAAGTLDFGAFFAEMAAVMAVNLAAAAFALVGAVALTVAMADRIEDRQTSVGSAYRNSMGYLPSVAGATLVAMVAFFVVGVVVLLMSALATFPLTRSGNTLLGLLGFVILFVPIMAVGLAWLAATFGILPAAIVEGRRAMAALQRSFSLCNGGWLRVMGIMIVAMIINMAPSFAITALFGLDNLFTSPDQLGTIDSERQWLLNTANLVIAPLTTPFMVGSIMILFHDRRVRKEAYDLQTAADTMGPGTR